jgi:hypothetical protein
VITEEVGAGKTVEMRVALCTLDNSRFTASVTRWRGLCGESARHRPIQAENGGVIDSEARHPRVA